MINMEHLSRDHKAAQNTLIPPNFGDLDKAAEFDQLITANMPQLEARLNGRWQEA